MENFRPSRLTVLVLCIIFAACQATTSSDPQVTDPWGYVEVQRFQTIEIGVSVVTAGEGIGAQGEDILRGAELAIAEYGSIDSFRVELVAVHVQCSPGGGRSAALSLVADTDIAAVIGPTCSTSCAAAASIYEEAHYTTVSPSCGASRLTDQVAHNRAFLRTIYDDVQEGDAAARFAYLELGHRRAALITDGTLDTVDLATAFETSFGELGGTIVSQQQITQGDPGTLAEAFAQVRETDADFIYAPLLPGDAAALVSQRATTIQNIQLIGGRHYWTHWFLDEVGRNGEGIYAVGPLLTNPSYSDLLAQFVTTYGAEPSSSMFAYAYDAAMLILTAIDNVARRGEGDTLLIGRQLLRDTLYATATFAGTTGTLTCTTWGDCSDEHLGVAQIQDQTWTVVYVP